MRIIKFSRAYLPAVIASTALIVFGIVGYAIFGFNLGVDFQAGINETVQLAYPTMEVGYSGQGNAVITVSETKATIVFSGAEIQGKTVEIDFKTATTLGQVVEAFKAIPGVTATSLESESLDSALLVPTFQGDTRLGATPFVLHRAPAGDEERFATIEKVRAAFTGLGEVSVQAANPASLQRYIVRVQDKNKDKDFSTSTPEAIRTSLEKAFGERRVVVMRTDYVGARYSESLGRQSAFLFLMTVVIIMLYAWVRFKFQYGFGAVLAVIHDALMIVCFVVWTRMEFNTSTIAAILTILGYSINDTIVQFDRVRETRRLEPTAKFVDVLNKALSITLGRTIITTAATMITVLSIFFFTSGSLKDFALALFVGMVSGTYSTIFIASAFVLYWEERTEKRTAKLQALHAGLAPAVAGKPAQPKAAQPKPASAPKAQKPEK